MPKDTQKVDSDLCVICHAHGADKRHLRMRCMYAIEEVVPEMIFNKKNELYEAWICKTCRGELLGAMKEWRDRRVLLRKVPKDHDGYIDEYDSTRNIPMRINGVVVMMNEDEYNSYKKSHATN